MKKILSLILCAVLAAGISGCSDKSEKKVVVASKPHSEQYILAEMITLVIENGTDISVEKKLGIGGGTANIQPAMESGEIDIYPEYTGTGWLFVLKEELINDPEELYESVKDAYAEKYDMKWLGMYGFNNTYALAMKRSAAEEMGIETYSDLAEKGGDLVFGAEYDFYEREDGFPGLEDAYGLSFENMVELDIGLKYEAIGTDQVDVINAFSTDGLIKKFDLRVLEDDKMFFPAYNAATIVRQETLDQYPELEAVLETLTGQISDDEMTELNYLVENEKMDPAKVAEDFLKGKGLL
ncbi:MAG: glycine/betaine ABC transporter substrate-binding protein [Clostridiales bacterium]|nr:MAG: glycine/betaine ABC transporter substrate-binding protein [Clostridiales bacterium]